MSLAIHVVLVIEAFVLRRRKSKVPGFQGDWFTGGGAGPVLSMISISLQYHQDLPVLAVHHDVRDGREHDLHMKRRNVWWQEEQVARPELTSSNRNCVAKSKVI